MIFPSPHGSPDDQSANLKNLDEEYADISEARRRQALHRARNWFVLLVSAGLALGVVVAFGIVQALNYFGLTNKPDAPLPMQIEQNRGQ